MATKVVNLKQLPSVLVKGLVKPIQQADVYFKQLGARIDNDTQLTFRLEGSRSGLRAWKKFSPNTLKTRLGTPKIRYGTDKKPKRSVSALKQYKSENNLWYKPGVMKGYESERRYASDSKLLQASGLFRKSFGAIQTSKKKLKYGTVHPLAKKIMSKPTRQALNVTDGDITSYTRLWRKFYDDRIKF